MPYAARLATAHCRASRTFEVDPCPVWSSTRRFTNFTPGATPRISGWLLPIRPATCVPCPYGSIATEAGGFARPVVKSRDVLTRAMSPSSSRPESITATVTLPPFTVVVLTRGL